MEIRKIKIALIEDDDNLRFLVSTRLKKEGYIVAEAENGVSGENLIISENPDIVLLDWMLPEKDGAEICEHVRNKGFKNLIIMITAKDQDNDKIKAYNDFGVSDYITKPFSMDVLVALLGNKAKLLTNISEPETFKFGDMIHHPHIHTLIKNGQKIELTILENRILYYFLKQPNTIIKRNDLMKNVWGHSADINTRTLDMHIVRLRKKIEKNPESPQILITVRGSGYKFNL